MAFIFSFPNLYARTMGMSFLIITEKQLFVCENEIFPEGLSWFFERIGKFGNKSEFIQVQELLNVNLDLFNTEKFEYDEKGNCVHNWFEIDSVHAIIDDVIERIDANPNFCSKIIYDTKYSSYDEWRHESDSLFEVINIKEQEKEQGRITDEEYSDFLYENLPQGTEYPIRNDYLSSGLLKKDLLELKRILNCYKKHEVGQICFIYM